jgi:hypothetical protein
MKASGRGTKPEPDINFLVFGFISTQTGYLSTKFNIFFLNLTQISSTTPPNRCRIISATQRLEPIRRVRRIHAESRSYENPRLQFRKLPMRAPASRL